MFNVKDEHGHYNLWRQTGLALLPLLLAIIAYPLLPNRVYVPTAVTSLTPWGIKSNIFIYPVFCLILWFFIWLFIFFNRLYEKSQGNPPKISANGELLCVEQLGVGYFGDFDGGGSNLGKC